MRTSSFLLIALFAGALATQALGQPAPARSVPSAKPETAVAPSAIAPAAPTVAPADAPAATVPAGPEVKIKDIEPVSHAATKGAKDSSGHDTLSVDFPEEEIRNILRNVADLFELNLVIPETLQGKTSVKLRDVTWRQIFQVVLSPVGYTYVEDGSIIKIVSNESLQQEPTTTEVFVLNYARASDILPTISSLVESGAGGKIVVDARSNALVITERPSRFNRIRPIIESLDRATDQVMIESKFVEITDRDVRNLGVNWASLSSMELSASSLGGTYNRTRGQTLSDGSEGGNATTSGSTGTTNNTSTSGQNTGSSNANTVSSTNGTVTSTATTGSTGDLTNTLASSVATGITSSSETTLNLVRSLANSSSTDRTTTAVFSASDFKLILSALNTLNNTRIVSNPTIVTLNNTEATINVGEEFPIPNYTYNQERGTFEVSGFTYRPIGIILKVTPQVNARGFVKLNLEPEVSQRNGETTFGGAGGASIPIIATRKAKTQVSLKDGYTMGIGGLLRRQTTDSSTKVPLLGDIPLLGNAFKSKSKNTETTNLLIFITAKVVSAEGGSIEQIFDPNQVRELQLKKSDLPGYRETTSPLMPEVSDTPASAKKKKPFFRINRPQSSESK